MPDETMPPEEVPDKAYPAREKFFAHRLVRILTKDAVANELGSEVCWLLTVVAMQEDAKRYRGPVTYYNGQLLPLCGFSSDKVLDRARAKAIKAGYLAYIPGGRRAAGKYWCLIPSTVKDIPDGPCDETEFETGMNGDSMAIETAVERPLNGGLGDHLGSVETAVLRRSTLGSKGDPSYLSPDPIPIPVPSTPNGVVRSQRKRFVAPTLEQATEYGLSRDSPIDPVRFWNYYEANGWRVGRNPMKDWQAAFRNWEKNNDGQSAGLFGKATRSTTDANNDAGAEYLRRKEAQLAGSEAGEFLGPEGAFDS